jgi:hypothetical protein
MCPGSGVLAWPRGGMNKLSATTKARTFDPAALDLAAAANFAGQLPPRPCAASPRPGTLVVSDDTGRCGAGKRFNRFVASWHSGAP